MFAAKKPMPQFRRLWYLLAAREGWEWKSYFAVSVHKETSLVLLFQWDHRVCSVSKDCFEAGRGFEGGEEGIA